ncbi:MAG TPA: ATP-binding protein, partial [Candidatus Angelobacter sp.]
MPKDLSLRVLVLAQFGRDAELLQSFLQRHQFPGHVVSGPEEFFRELDNGAATAIITEESLPLPIEEWSKRLEMQPTWSDFPLIVLTSAGTSATIASAKLSSLRFLGNVTLVERPIRSESLLSAVETALRARLRQYEVRDFMSRQANSEEALRRTEKLAVAGRLAASLAHEINNPLTSVTNLLFLVRSAHDLKEAQHWATLAEDELRRVTEISNHTLRFHRSSRGPEEAEVRNLLDSSVVLFRAKLRNQQIDVSVACEKDTHVVCTLGEIRQVLVNLIANAVDAMPRGGKLLLRGTKVPHPATSTHGVRISVVDHGTGISRTTRHKLFEPFFTTKGNTGTGLGLWLTKDIIDRHQGLIQVRNHSHPRGAVFSIWIPEKPVESNGTQ